MCSKELLSAIFIHVTLIAGLNSLHSGNDKPVCSREMFQNDSNALWACATLDALQHNWFPSPIAGLYDYLEWNGFDGFWQNGAVLLPMVDYMRYTNSSRYHAIVISTLRSITDLLNAYYGPSCDDEMWFGLAYAKIYDVTKNESFLNATKDVFNWTWTTCWDQDMTCKGGLFFGGGHGKKITIINGQALIVAAQLYRFTQDKQYLNKSLMVLNYLVANEVINQTTYLVSDSIDIYSCQPNTKLNLTYNSGVIIGGLVELYRVTLNRTYLDLAQKIATANIWHNSFHGILTEYCDFTQNCDLDDDAKMFKGIFMLNLHYLMEYSDTDQTDFYKRWIQFNIDSLIINSMCHEPNISNCAFQAKDGKPKVNITGPLWTENWHGPFNYSGPQQQTSALCLFIAGIRPNITCQGPACDYNPDLPKITKISCQPHNPCPPGQPCCALLDRYFTCCETTQYCYDGGCYDKT